MSNSGALNGDSIFKSGAYSGNSKLRQIKQNREYICIFVKVETLTCCRSCSLHQKEKKKQKNKAIQQSSNSPSFFLQPPELIIFCSMIINKETEGKAK